MSRDDGFQRADIDVGYHSDPKIVALRRRVADNQLTRQCVLVHQATILASWRVGERVAIDDAALPWMFDDIERVRSALVKAELIDDDSMLRQEPWDSWFLPALARRIERRESGRKGGLAKAEATPLAPPQATRNDAPTTTRSSRDERLAKPPAEPVAKPDSRTNALAEPVAEPPAQPQPNQPSQTSHTIQPDSSSFLKGGRTASDNGTYALGRDERARAANGLGAAARAVTPHRAAAKKYDELTEADFGINPVSIDESTSFTEKMAKAGLKPEIVPVDRDIMDESL